MANWTLVGQVGKIIEKENLYLISIAENKYKPIKNSKNWHKESTIWFNCISDFEPKFKIGDTVVAEGIFVPSTEENIPFCMKINHVGVISKEKAANTNMNVNTNANAKKNNGNIVKKITEPTN